MLATLDGRWGYERAAALLAVDQALVLEALVDAAHGVDVDAGRLGDLAQPGEALPGLERAVADARAQRPRELHANRDLGVAVDGQIQPARPTGGRSKWLPAHAVNCSPPRPRCIVCW